MWSRERGWVIHRTNFSCVTTLIFSCYDRSRGQTQRPNEDTKRKVSHQLHGLVFGDWDLAKVHLILFTAVCIEEEARRQSEKEGEQSIARTCCECPCQSFLAMIEAEAKHQHEEGGEQSIIWTCLWCVRLAKFWPKMLGNSAGPQGDHCIYCWFTKGWW